MKNLKLMPWRFAVLEIGVVTYPLALVLCSSRSQQLCPRRGFCVTTAGQGFCVAIPL
jgi:hypothetical protein